MKILASSLLTAVFCVAALSATPGAQLNLRTFTGKISDSACGLHHTMASNGKQCTLECVRMGSRLVLADKRHQKVYALSDQAKAMPFAGEDVKVIGTLKRYTIEVISIASVNPPVRQVRRALR